MGDSTGISWTDATWNCVRGCSRVSDGCVHCYAEVQAARIVRMGKGKPTAYDGLVKLVTRDVRQMKIVDGEATADTRTVTRTEARWTGEVRLVPEQLAWPLRKKRPLRIFVNSMSDLFHEKLANEQIAAVFGAMAMCPQHTFQVLTKRARRMSGWFEWVSEHGRSVIISELASHFRDLHLYGDPRVDVRADVSAIPWPLPNVWLGVSVENQEAANGRIPWLTRTPAAKHFLSGEPLLGPVNLTAVDGGCFNPGWLDWVIGGCESGPGARECSVEWLRSLRDQCGVAGVAFFLKQAVETSGSPFDVDSQGRARGVTCGTGSKMKPGRVVERPYLDDRQWLEFPP